MVLVHGHDGTVRISPKEYGKYINNQAQGDKPTKTEPACLIYNLLHAFSQHSESCRAAVSLSFRHP